MSSEQGQVRESRDKLFKCMEVELIWRISRSMSTLVLGMITQGACVIN